MEETYLLNLEGVKKKILHGGRGQLPDFKDGSKITFHFQTLKDNFERTVIDDSRLAGLPMEIIVGKMFKIEVWESLLTSMRIGEVAEFWCDAVHTGMYALVSKGMRKIAEGKDPLEGQKHRCGMGNMFDYHSTGYEDLNELLKTPQPLIFIMELFKVEDPSTYKRDTWAMNNEEKLKAVPKLHHDGNRLVLSRKFKEAAEKYQEAVICLRNVQAKEKPWEEDWLRLEKLVTPLVLNYCQCQLELGEYYEVLEHTTDLLQKDNENVKAYFKRAKAHAAVWNEKEARTDFQRVVQLDPSLAAAVRKELKALGERMRKKQVEDRKRYKGLFQEPAAREDTEENQDPAEEKQPGTGGSPQKEASQEEGPELEDSLETTGAAGNRETEGGSREEFSPQKEAVMDTGERDHGQGRDSGEGKAGPATSGPKEHAGFGQWGVEEEREEMNPVGQGQNEAVPEEERDGNVVRGVSSGKEAAGGPTAGVVVDCEAKGNLEGESFARERKEQAVECQEEEFRALQPGKAQEENSEENTEGDFQVQGNRGEREVGVVTEVALRAGTISEGLREQSSLQEEEMNLGRNKTEASLFCKPELERREYEAGPRLDETVEVGAEHCSEGVRTENAEDKMNLEAESSRGEEGDPEEGAKCEEKETQAVCSSRAQEERRKGEVSQEWVGAEMGFGRENSTVGRSVKDSEVEQAESGLNVHWEGPETVGGRAGWTDDPLSTQRSSETAREELATVPPPSPKEDGDKPQAPAVSCELNTCTAQQPNPIGDTDGEEEGIQ